MKGGYTLTIELKNKYKLLAAFNNAPRDLAEAIQAALGKTAGETLGKVKLIIATGRGMWKPPLRTGMMMQNIHISEQAPLKIVIRPNMSITPYAGYVHQGTPQMKARPFFRITKETEQKNIQDFFSRALDNFIKELARKLG